MKFLETYQFHDAWVLWFLLIIPLIIMWYIVRINYQHNPFKTSSLKNLKSISSSKINLANHFFFGVKMIALSSFIIALARPQLNATSDSFIEQYTEGIDIVISMDASGSMLAKDFKPNRFEAAKEVAEEFVSKRTNDRIGLVVFQGEAYTQVPLTSDNKIVMEVLKNLKREEIKEGTAIGMGLATAINRLRESTAPSRVVILLTDGVNTHGKIHPLTAAEMAKEFGIRVYTIGVGTNGKAQMPVAINPVTGKYIYDYVPVEIDEKTLNEIAKMTGGKYFRATDKESLREVYNEIDKMEKEKIKEIEYQVDLPEKNLPFLLLGFALFLIEPIFKPLFFKTLS